MINGLGIGDDKVHTVDFKVAEFFADAAFPYTPTQTDSIASAARAIQERLFVSPGRIGDLGALFKIRIIQKLVPGLRKEGYEDSAHAASPSAREQQQDAIATDQQQRPESTTPTRDPLRDDRFSAPARPHPFDDPLAAGMAPRRPFPPGEFAPPGFEDEYEVHTPRTRGGLGGERRPLNIGERDLYPPGLGPRDPLGSGGFGGGGMHPRFDDPLFGGVAGPGRNAR